VAVQIIDAPSVGIVQGLVHLFPFPLGTVRFVADIPTTCHVVLLCLNVGLHASVRKKDGLHTVHVFLSEEKLMPPPSLLPLAQLISQPPGNTETADFRVSTREKSWPPQFFGDCTCNVSKISLRIVAVTLKQQPQHQAVGFSSTPNTMPGAVGVPRRANEYMHRPRS